MVVVLVAVSMGLVFITTVALQHSEHGRRENALEAVACSIVGLMLFGAVSGTLYLTGYVSGNMSALAGFATVAIACRLIFKRLYDPWHYLETEDSQES